MKVIAGKLDLPELQLSGPIITSATQALYLDIELQAGAALTLPLPQALNAVIYLFAGDMQIEHEPATLDSAHELTQGDQVQLKSEQGGRCLLLAGKPLNEPIAQYGPFVMNTMDEVEQALQDYRAGCLTA